MHGVERVNVKYRYAIIDGLRIRYSDIGSGHAIVLIHGLGGSIEAWLDTMRTLKDSYRVIALDLRGFGSSQKPVKLSSITDFSRDVVGVMDYAGVESASILGFSMGGLVALETYRQYRGRVDSLILADTSPRLAVDADSIRKAFSSPKAAYQSLKRLTRRLKSTNTLKLLAEALTQNDPGYIVMVVDAVRNADYWDLLPHIKVPVLVLIGEHDSLVPLDTAKRMVNAIPNAVLEVIKDAGHLSKFDDPTTFNLTIIKFLDKVYHRNVAGESY